jgi:hypothetical protein
VTPPWIQARIARAERIRSAAIHLLDLAASNRPFTLAEISRMAGIMAPNGKPAFELARETYRRIYWVGTNAECYAEAAGLLRDGWIPGEQILLRC